MRLYGRGVGYGSQARVTAGFRRVLAAEGMLEGFCNLDELQPSKLGATAHTALFTGPLSLLYKMKMNARHERRLVMVAPNSSEIGRWAKEALEEFATHLLTPSHWARDVLRKHLPKLPVTVVPHGLDEDFGVPIDPKMDASALREAKDERMFALHLSSSELQRKGTRALIEAWKQLYGSVIAEQSGLTLVLERGAMDAMRTLLEEARGYRVHAIDRLGPMGTGLPPPAMARVYHSCHLVIQPSRGEGFGMVPLEARACGTPVVATVCTGHSEHMDHRTPGVVAIEHGELEPIDDMPNAMAPAVTVDAIKRALESAYRNWAAISYTSRLHRHDVLKQWRWEAVLKNWIETEKRY